MYVGHMTTYRSWFSLTMWFPGIKLSLSGLMEAPLPMGLLISIVKINLLNISTVLHCNIFRSEVNRRLH